MTQDASRRPTPRRSNRGRNRPLLVTSTSNTTENEATTQTTDETTPTLAESVAEVQAQNPPTAPTRRRLPNFFSTVGKNTQEASTQEKDIAQARIARVTRGKVASAKTSSVSKSSENGSETPTEAKKASAKPAARPTTPTRPASAFKTRYLFGMVLYLLAANFIGILITDFFQANHIDSILTQFPLFGGQIIIRTSTLAFLAMLVIILVVLARFDLIPRSLGAMSGQPPASRNRRTDSSSRTSEDTRSSQPTMRQGVKGADDDLYREYRSNQRRRK